MFVVYLLLWQLNFLLGLIKFLILIFTHSLAKSNMYAMNVSSFESLQSLCPESSDTRILYIYTVFFSLVTQSLVALTCTGSFHYQMNAQHCAAIETGNSGTELFSNLSGFLNLKDPPKPDHGLRAARCLLAIVPAGRESSEKERLQRWAEWLTCSLFRISNIHF